VANIGHLK